MAINNTQKNIIAKKQELRGKIIAALRASEDFADVDFFETVGDCDIAFYVVDGNGKRQVFELSGSFKKANTKLNGNREPEDVMCDLLDAYEAKQEGRRCREALAASKPKKSSKKEEGAA
jgi:hypothetical protein